MSEMLVEDNNKFLELEECLIKGEVKLSFSELKDYINFLKENYFNIEKERLNIAIEFLNKDSRKNVKGLAENLCKFIIKEETEISRVMSLYDFDKSFGNYIYVAGVDEVGRGPLAGPIVAGAVVLQLRYKDYKDLILGIKDSKKLSEKKREELSEIIKEKCVSYNIAMINSKEIDERGIAWCNNEVLKRAVEGLKIKPDLVLSDGYAVKNLNIENEFIIKGDAKSASIASASIIAKVYRDNLMKEYAKTYNHYGFEKNAGYGTEEHISAIRKHGTCRIHRMSFLKNIL